MYKVAGVQVNAQLGTEAAILGGERAALRKVYWVLGGGRGGPLLVAFVGSQRRPWRRRLKRGGGIRSGLWYQEQLNRSLVKFYTRQARVKREAQIAPIDTKR